jgi:hypothetical protein
MNSHAVKAAGHAFGALALTLCATWAAEPEWPGFRGRDEATYRSRIEGGEAFTSSPWAYNGKVFCLNEEGKTFVIAAGEKYELLHVNLLDEMAQATPAIVADRLLLRTENRLYSIRGKG